MDVIALCGCRAQYQHKVENISFMFSLAYSQAMPQFDLVSIIVDLSQLSYHFQ